MSDARVTELAVNLDDVTPQVLGDAQQQLMAAGALDVWTVSIGMKKQRPGVMLCVLCATGDRKIMARRMIELTGSFGVRYREWDRLTLDRRYEVVQTEYGEIRIKVGTLEGEVVSARPEYDDAHAAAGRVGRPVREVIDAAMAAWRALQ